MPPPKFYQEDEVLGKIYDRVLVKRLYKYLKPHQKGVFLAMSLAFASNGISLIQPLLIMTAVDKHIAVGDFMGLTWISLFFLLTILIEFSIRYVQIYVTNKTGQLAIYDLRLDLFKHVQKLPLSFFNKNPVGRILTRLTGDIEVLNDLFSTGVVNLVGSIFALIGIVIILLKLNWQLALANFAVLPLIIIVTQIFRKYSREGFREVRKAVAALNSDLQENISGMTTVQSFVQEKRSAKRFSDLAWVHYVANIKTIYAFALFFPAIEVITASALAIIIYVGGGGVIKGTITAGMLIAFIEYMHRFFDPIREISNQYNILQQAMASSERIFQLIDEKEIIENPEKPLPLGGKNGRARGEIEFKNVSFGYKPNEPVLKDVSFKIDPGKMTAIVGSTGAGKTTTISLLSRFWDVNSGAILVDGHDIRNLSKKDLRNNVGVVLQDVFLFSDSVAFNIGLGNLSVSKEYIQDICTQIGLHEFIETLPEGYQAPLGERGRSLSLGQRQLISFARVLAYDPGILVLDEATANTDSATEKLIQTALETTLKNRTSIVIAHRLSTIQKADQILVMHHGKIKERGTHQELLGQKGIYHKLYQLQFAHQQR